MKEKQANRKIEDYLVALHQRNLRLQQETQDLLNHNRKILNELEEVDTNFFRPAAEEI